MRIWDLDPALLCNRHLLGEHRELHAVWTILTTGKRGYAHHPETLRWRGRLAQRACECPSVGAGSATVPPL